MSRNFENITEERDREIARIISDKIGIELKKSPRTKDITNEMAQFLASQNFTPLEYVIAGMNSVILIQFAVGNIIKYEQK